MTKSAWQNRITRYGSEAPDQLAANPRNWRTHPKSQTDALAGVLREVGVVQNVIVNERTGYVVDGHARISIALRDGQASVPVTYVDLSEEEEALILATLDPLSAMAGADAAQLDALLRDVSSGDPAVQQMLSDLAEQHDILGAVEAGSGGDEFDVTPDESGATRCQSGDLWLIDGGRHRLIIGDSTDAAVVARLMGGERAMLCTTDPPYGVLYDAEWRGKAGHATMGATRKGKVQADDRAYWTDVWRLLDAQIMYCWHASAFSDVVMDSLRDADYEVRQQIIWAKTIPIISRGAYHWQHEPCWYAVKKGANANWIGDRKQTTLWTEPPPNHIMAGSKDDKTPHPTQKPIALFERPILNHVEQGGVVVDPFLGSGTALIAAHRTRRRCFGFEIDPKYGDVILRRCEAEGLTVERADATS